MASLISPLFCLGIWLLTQLRLSIPLIFLAAIIAVSSFYVVWTVSTSAAIIREHERRTYDQLCLAPSGALGANWAICTAVLHRSDALGWIDFLRKLVAGLLLFIFLSVLMTTTLRQNVFNPFQFLALLLDMLTLTVISYVDHMQSIVLGSLIGMLVPTYSRIQRDAHVWGAVVFMTLQTFSLFAMLLVGLFIGCTETSLILLSLLVFYLTREVLIFALWGLLVYRLNAHSEDFIVTL